MKKILIIAAALVTAYGVQAQGQFSFTTLGATTGIIFVDSVASGVKANTYKVDYAYSTTAGVSNPALLTSAPAAQVKTINSSGIFIGTVQNFGGASATAGLPTLGAATISLQVRAWAPTSATYADAVAAQAIDGTTRYGSSTIWNVTLGDPTGTPPGTATSIKNAFPSFAVTARSEESCRERV